MGCVQVPNPGGGLTLPSDAGKVLKFAADSHQAASRRIESASAIGAYAH